MMVQQVAFWMEILLSLAMLSICFEYFLIRREFKSTGLFADSTSAGSYPIFLLILTVTVVSGLLLPLFPAVIGALILSELYFAHRFKGSFNGGSSYMSFVLVLGLSIYEYAPLPAVKNFGLLYVGVQCLLSFLISGVAKIANPNWRSGVELRKIMRLPQYAVPPFFTSTLALPKVSLAVSWTIILFEVFIIVGFLNSPLALTVILVALTFNFLNMVVFGLNRFLLFWLAAYPALYYCFTVSR